MNFSKLLYMLKLITLTLFKLYICNGLTLLLRSAYSYMYVYRSVDNLQTKFLPISANNILINLSRDRWRLFLLFQELTDMLDQYWRVILNYFRCCSDFLGARGQSYKYIIDGGRQNWIYKQLLILLLFRSLFLSAWKDLSDSETWLCEP